MAVAIAGIAVPSDYYHASKLYYREDSYRLEIAGFARRAIAAAAEHGAKLLIFPELFLPLPQAETILQFAHDNGLAIVAGIEAEVVRGEYSNYVNIRLPSSRMTYRQFKAHGSNDEPNQLKTQGGQVIFKDTEIGTFTVIICSDYRESDVIHAVESCGELLDLVIVCSMASYPGVYRQYAMADSHRLHSFVALVNNDAIKNPRDPSVGCAVFAPARTVADSELVGRKIELGVSSPAGTEAVIYLYDLEYDELAKDKEKPSKFEAPPHRRVLVKRKQHP